MFMHVFFKKLYLDGGDIITHELIDHLKDLTENGAVRVRRTVAPEAGPSLN